VSAAGGQLLANKRRPEKDFIAQALLNTYWLRDRIRGIVNAEPWITPAVVFTNAFVEPFPPIKGVRVVNQKYLLRVLRTQRQNAQNAILWEHRERIREGLYAPTKVEAISPVPPAAAVADGPKVRRPGDPAAAPLVSFLGAFIRNLLLMILVLGAVALFVVLFFPKTLEIFATTGYCLIALGLGPVIILALLFRALPRRRR
jgi:hypothetical protein